MSSTAPLHTRRPGVTQLLEPFRVEALRVRVVQVPLQQHVVRFSNRWSFERRALGALPTLTRMLYFSDTRCTRHTRDTQYRYVSIHFDAYTRVIQESCRVWRVLRVSEIYSMCASVGSAPSARRTKDRRFENSNTRCPRTARGSSSSPCDVRHAELNCTQSHTNQFGFKSEGEHTTHTV